MVMNDSAPRGGALGKIVAPVFMPVKRMLPA
jgi:hypothetical protein